MAFQIPDDALDYDFLNQRFTTSKKTGLFFEDTLTPQLFEIAKQRIGKAGVKLRIERDLANLKTDPLDPDDIRLFQITLYGMGVRTIKRNITERTEGGVIAAFKRMVDEAVDSRELDKGS